MLWEISFLNVQMLLSAIPDMDLDEEDPGKAQAKRQSDELSEFFGKASL